MQKFQINFVCQNTMCRKQGSREINPEKSFRSPDEAKEIFKAYIKTIQRAYWKKTNDLLGLSSSNLL